MLTGRFDVLEATFGPNGYIERFHATFEQHCEGATAALRGEVRVVNPPPPPALAISMSVSNTGRVDRLSGRAYVTTTFTCTVPTTLNLNETLNQRLSRFALATSSRFLSWACSPAPTSLQLEFIPVGDVPFGVGMAEVNAAASAYDPNYGQFVNVAVNQPVKLRTK
jgi:hypothetical protein